MNKTDFIAELAKKTGLSAADSEKVNEVIESNNLLGNAAKIVSQIAAKLNILAKAKDIIGGGIMDKIKNPFGGQ